MGMNAHKNVHLSSMDGEDMKYIPRQIRYAIVKFALLSLP